MDRETHTQETKATTSRKSMAFTLTGEISEVYKGENYKAFNLTSPTGLRVFIYWNGTEELENFKGATCSVSGAMSYRPLMMPVMEGDEHDGFLGCRSIFNAYRIRKLPPLLKNKIK